MKGKNCSGTVKYKKSPILDRNHKVNQEFYYSESNIYRTDTITGNRISGINLLTKIIYKYLACYIIQNNNDSEIEY